MDDKTFYRLACEAHAVEQKVDLTLTNPINANARAAIYAEANRMTARILAAAGRR